jgi:hypothetical protein
MRPRSGANEEEGIFDSQRKCPYIEQLRQEYLKPSFNTMMPSRIIMYEHYPLGWIKTSIEAGTRATEEATNKEELPASKYEDSHKRTTEHKKQRSRQQFGNPQDRTIKPQGQC